MVGSFRGIVAAALTGILSSGCVTQQSAGSALGAGDVSPQSLIGLSPNQIAGRLGEPELRRSEPPAEVWQYRTETCVVDLYLYDDGGRLQVLSYQVRPRAQAAVRAERCVADVVAQAGPAATS